MTRSAFLRRARWHLAAAGLIGMQFGVLGLAELARAHFDLSTLDAFQTLSSHLLLGLVIGVPLAGGAWLLFEGLSLMRGRRVSPRLGEFVAALISTGVLAALVGLMINIQLLPSFRAPESLRVDAIIALIALGLAALWARRPAKPALERTLTRSLLGIDLALVILLVGATGASTTRNEQTATQSAPAPNMVLILIDTLRPDHLGFYGYDEPTSSALDRLAGEATVFDRAFSSTNWTRPAVASLFTSTMPSRHRVLDFDRALSPEMPVLAEVLQQAGYQTAFVTAGINIQPNDGYRRGVEHFDYSKSSPLVTRTVLMLHFVLKLAPSLESVFAPGRKTLPLNDPRLIKERALAWADDTDPARPIFLYVHVLGPHSPYEPPRPHSEEFGVEPPDPVLLEPPRQAWSPRGWISSEQRDRMIGQYDGEIAWHDLWLGRLLDGLRERGRLDDAVVVVLADHGEGFGEHHVWGHNVSNYDEVVRIPLVVWRSADREARRVSNLVSIIDVAPTLVELAGAPAEPDFDGRSLLPLLGPSGSPGRSVFTENPTNQELAVRTAEWTFFEGNTAHGFRQWLYRADDVRQENELSARHPEIAAELRALAHRRQAEDRSRRTEAVRIELDEERRNELRELGYLE